MSTTYDLFAIRYGHHHRTASHNFISGDPHDGPMPLDYFVWAIVGQNRSFVFDTGFDAARGALGPWLLAVARNRAIDHIRSAGARNVKNTLELEEREHTSREIGADLDLQNKDQAKIIRSAMSKLTENQRRVIELAYYEGLSQTEMAERIGQHLGTVKTWVRSALKNLRDELGAVVPV